MVEIHIPKKGIHGRLEPIQQPAEDELPDDLQILRAMEEHETLAVTHLERSNALLNEALQDEEDADFRIAVIENLAVLAQKRKLLEQVQQKIRELDPNGVANAALTSASAQPPAGPAPSSVAPASAASQTATAAGSAAGSATASTAAATAAAAAGPAAAPVNGPPLGGFGGMMEEEDEEEEDAGGGAAADLGGLHL